MLEVCNFHCERCSILGEDKDCGLGFSIYDIRDMKSENDLVNAQRIEYVLSQLIDLGERIGDMKYIVTIKKYDGILIESLRNGEIVEKVFQYIMKMQSDITQRMIYLKNLEDNEQLTEGVDKRKTLRHEISTMMNQFEKSITIARHLSGKIMKENQERKEYYNVKNEM